MKFFNRDLLFVGRLGIIFFSLVLLGWWAPMILATLPLIWGGIEDRYGFWFHIYGSARIVLIATAIWSLILHHHPGINRLKDLSSVARFLSLWMAMSVGVLIESFVSDPSMWSVGNSKELFLFRTDREAWLYTQFLVSINSLLGFFGISLQYSNERLELDFQSNNLAIWIVNIVWFIVTVVAYSTATRFVWNNTWKEQDFHSLKTVFLRGRVAILMVLWLTNSIWLHYRGYQLEDFVVMSFMTLVLMLLSIPFTYLLMKIALPLASDK